MYSPITTEEYHTRIYVNSYNAYAEVLLIVITGGIRNVCIFLVEFSSTSTNSATIDASPPLCAITKQHQQTEMRKHCVAYFKIYRATGNSHVHYDFGGTIEIFGVWVLLALLQFRFGDYLNSVDTEHEEERKYEDD